MAWARWSSGTAVDDAMAATANPAPASSSGEQSCEDVDPAGEPVIWEVIGGGKTNGLQVRIGQSLSSDVAPARLATGALVRQREIAGNRLHYELISGSGPSRGWVTVSLGSKALLVRKDDDKAAEAAGSGEAGDEACGCASCRRPLEWSDFAEGDYSEGWDCNNLPNCGNGSFNCGSFRWFCSKCQVDVCGPCFEERRRAYRTAVGEATEPEAEEAGCPGTTPRRPSTASRPSRGSTRLSRSSRTSWPDPTKRDAEQAVGSRVRKFAWDHPLSQAEGRARCLTSDTVAGNIQRLAELQERNAALEAAQARWEVERGLLMAKVEQLESMLRRCGPPAAGAAAAAGQESAEVPGRCPSPVSGARSEASSGGDAAAVSGTALGVELAVAVEQPGSGSAVTSICFGQERHYLEHVLLAVAHADGLAVLYRCDRPSAEPAPRGGQTLFSRLDASGGDGGTGSLPSNFSPPGRHASASSCSPKASGRRGGELTFVRRLAGHTRGICCMTFGPLEEQLLTASHDRSLRIWDVASGELRGVFTDACLVAAAAFLPLVPGAFVASVLGAKSVGHFGEDVGDESQRMRHSSRRASLRLVSAQGAGVLHALPAASDVHALCFDSTGRFLLAGTRRSTLLALEVTGTNDRLAPRMRVQLGVGKVTSIVRASNGSSGRQRMLIASEGKEHSSVTMVDCVYAAEGSGGHLLSIANQRQVSISNRPLPFHCCYSPFGPGFAVSGTKDGGLLLYGTDKPKPQKLASPHRGAVAAAAASSRGSLIVSADAKGGLIVWRCQSAEAQEDANDAAAVASCAGSEHIEAPEAAEEEEEELRKPDREPLDAAAAAKGDSTLASSPQTLRDPDEEAAAIARAEARKARRDAKVRAKLEKRPSAKELQAACRPALLDRDPGAGRLWIVVGGADKGGILVRSCENLTSMVYRNRLMTGATVEELQLVGNKLQYQRVRGDGPETGWVKLTYGNEPLLELQDELEEGQC